MIRLTVITLGKLKSPALIELEAEYRKRLSRFAQLDFVEVQPPKKFSSLAEAERKRAETELVLKSVPDKSYLVCLEERGKQFSSPDFARLIESHGVRESSRLTFAIAGADGWDRKLLEGQAKMSLSLSAMTMPHELARVVLVEQIYRALSILNHLPYHK